MKGNSASEKTFRTAAINIPWEQRKQNPDMPATKIMPSKTSSARSFFFFQNKQTNKNPNKQTRPTPQSYFSICIIKLFAVTPNKGQVHKAGKQRL